MLPAKFRGFASRVGRLASRALAWHKTSERDGALSATSSTASATSNSDASAYRPSRTSHTLRRALFAMLVAVATLLAMLILPPTHDANATNVVWDKFGNAMISADVNDPSSAFDNMKTGDCTDDLTSQRGCRDDYYPKVEPGAGTNGLTRITLRFVFNPRLAKDYYSARPYFFAFLPRGIKNFKIYREKSNMDFVWDKILRRKVYKQNLDNPWSPQESSNGGWEDINLFATGKRASRAVHYKGEKEFDDDWNTSIGPAGCGSKNYSTNMCEFDSLWKNKLNMFSTELWSWEKGELAAYRWTMVADVDPAYDPYALPFIVGYNLKYGARSEKVHNHYTAVGPYDTDGDGIPDFEEFMMGEKPDHGVDQTTKGGMKYDEVNNVEPFTSSESKNYFETGTWEGNTYSGHFVKDGGKTYKIPTMAGLVYSFEGNPTDENGKEVHVDYDNDHSTAHTLLPGHAWLDPLTGHVSFNPGPEHKRHTITFHVKVTYPDPSLYNCKHRDRLIEHLQAKFKVEPMSRFYYPEWDNTTVTAGSSKQSTEPHSKADSNLGTKYAKKLPAKSFTPKKYGKNGQEPLKWSSLTNGGDTTGKVTFSPEKPTDSGDYKTPVVVTYLDGSTSEDADSGNKGNPVYAPVTVTEPNVNDGDLHLNLYDGTQINNGQFGGWSFGDANNPKELSKGTKIGAPKGNKNNGIVLDSWANNAKGPITFRAVCHKKNDTKYKLLKPAEGNSKASGDINGLQFEEFRQWKRGNDKNCKDKNTCDLNTYLHNSEYNKDTMERSRALIGGKPKEGGEYECKVFAFHQAHDGKGMQHNGALTKFDKLAKDNGAGFVFDFDTGAFASSKGKEWVSGNFYFKIKLKDSQKYNPTYTKIPSIQAGTFANKETNSSSQPKSHTKIMVDGQKVNANGVPDEDLGGVEDGKALPPGTWFEIKKLVKKVDKTQPDKFPSEKELWSNFEDGEDNVKRDEHGKPVMEKGKVVPLNGTGREYGSVTFRPDKWKDAGQYWAEVVVHYPDGSASSDDDSINYKHPVYAKVNVTRDDKDNQLHLNLYKHYYDKGMGDGYDLKVGESLHNDATFDSWMTKSVGELHQHVICSKKGKDGKDGNYTYNTLPGHVDSKANNAKDIEKDGLRFKEEKVWKHASFKQQKQCRLDKKCDKDNYLYDGDGASEQTRGYFGGKAQKTGDYQCKVYVISGKDKSDAFEKAVKANIKKSPSKDPAAGLFDKKGDKYPYGEKGKGYETGSFEIRIHNDNHFYNPKYVDVSVAAGQKVENAVPQSVKSANGADKYQDVVKAGALPDGTWFEFKDATHGFEVNANGTKGKQVSLDWSYWAGNAADKAGDQSNKPDNPKDPNNHKGKHSAKDDGTRYGKVTFHPDQSVAPKAYFKEIVIHYPDGSTSDDPDSGNNGKPVYAKVTVGGLGGGADKDLKMTLLRSKDADPIHDTLGGNNSLTVMSGTSLTKNPYVLAWSLKDRSNISLRMMCTKQGEQKWSIGLDDTLNMHLNQNYGNSVKPWAFASAEQRKSCSENSNNCKANLLYGFTKNKDPNSIESAVSRSEDDIIGVPKKAGKYTCAVFALKSNALTVFNNTVNNSLIENKKYSSTDMKTTWFDGVTIGKDWNRITVDVNVIDPPKFSLPKTGGEGMSMALLVVAMIAMCVMCGAFFVDQTKWGHAMLVGAAGAAGAAVGAAAGMMRGLRSATQNSNSNSNSKISEIWRSLVKKVKDIRRFDEYSASAKDFVRKVTGWLRAAFRRVRRWATERWRC